MTEIWKDIEGFEGRYSVSNLGNVRSNSYTFNYFWRGKCVTKTTNTKILKPNISGGYLTVYLTKDKQVMPYTIHRLVAAAFISNPNNLPQVNHIDANKFNNCSNNLEWCTQSYNVKHALALGLGGLPNPGHIVKCIETGVIYKSQAEAGRAYGVTQATIRNAIVENRAFRGLHFIEV